MSSEIVIHKKDPLSLTPEEIEKLGDEVTFEVPGNIFSDLSLAEAKSRARQMNAFDRAMGKLGYASHISEIRSSLFGPGYYRYQYKRWPEKAIEEPGVIDI